MTHECIEKLCFVTPRGDDAMASYHSGKASEGPYTLKLPGGKSHHHVSFLIPTIPKHSSRAKLSILIGLVQSPPESPSMRFSFFFSLSSFFLLHFLFLTIPDPIVDTITYNKHINASLNSRSFTSSCMLFENDFG
jgi:hypothetical protein